MLNDLVALIRQKLTIESPYDEIQLVYILYNKALARFCSFEDQIICKFLQLPVTDGKNKYPDDLIDDLVDEVKPFVQNVISEVGILRNKKSDDIYFKNYIKLNNNLLKTPSSNSLNRLLVFIDLDDTLIRSSLTDAKDYDIRIKFDKNCYYVKFRPHLDLFLESMKKNHSIILFSAADREYTDAIVKHFKIEFDMILSKEHCTEFHMLYFKDLRRLNVDLRRVVLIDNLPLSFALIYENGLRIKEYCGSEQDKELIRIMNIVDRIKYSNDVRIEIVHKKYNLEYNE